MLKAFTDKRKFIPLTQIFAKSNFLIKKYATTIKFKI
jgi:hypothetical protein